MNREYVGVRKMSVREHAYFVVVVVIVAFCVVVCLLPFTLVKHLRAGEGGKGGRPRVRR